MFEYLYSYCETQFLAGVRLRELESKGKVCKSEGLKVSAAS